MMERTAASQPSRDRRLAAAAVYLIMQGSFGLFFALITTINLVYQFTVAGLNPLQLVLVGTVLESVAFLCEVPTGIVADLYSRRLSVVIGFALTGAGFLLEGMVPTFAAILASQVIWGAGYTFVSGAADAWLADEVGEVRAARLYLRASQLAQAGALIGTFVSVGLASIRLNVPIVAGGALLITLALFLALAMPERGFAPTPQPERNSFQKIGDTFLSGTRVVRHSPVLITILAVILVRGAASEAFDRLWQAHFVADFTFPALGNLDTIVWFGIIVAGARLLSIGATELVTRRVDTASHHGAARALLALNVLQLGAVVTLGLAGNFGLAVVAYLAASLCRTTSQPVFTAWINQGLAPATRATVLSISAQADALGQVAGGPVLGYVGKAASLRAAITLSGVLLAPAVPLLLNTLRRPVDAPLAVVVAEE